MGIVIGLIVERRCDCIREVEEEKKDIPSSQDIQLVRKAKYLMVSDIEAVKLIYENSKKNIEILKKIDEENQRIVPVIRAKIDDLMLKQSSKIVEIGTGNSCNNPCYQYNLELTKTCPKCGGKVEVNYENDYTIKIQYDDFKQCYQEVKAYNERKICTGVIFNNNIGKEDVDLDALFQYFDKVDNEKKCHYTINTNETIKEYDMPYHYMMIDGERYDFPYGIGMKEFFLMNEYEFFPNQISRIPYCNSVCFFYEQQMTRQELGQSFGYYGYAWIHYVFIYTCNLCGHTYHIIKTSPFAFRDKSKDPK